MYPFYKYQKEHKWLARRPNTLTQLLALRPEDKTKNLLKWLKWKQLSTPSVGEDARQTELSYITAGNAKLYRFLRKQSEVFYRVIILLWLF